MDKFETYSMDSTMQNNNYSNDYSNDYYSNNYYSNEWLMIANHCLNIYSISATNGKEKYIRLS